MCRLIHAPRLCGKHARCHLQHENAAVAASRGFFRRSWLDHNARAQGGGTRLRTHEHPPPVDILRSCTHQPACPIPHDALPAPACFEVLPSIVLVCFLPAAVPTTASSLAVRLRVFLFTFGGGKGCLS